MDSRAKQTNGVDPSSSSNYKPHRHHDATSSTQDTANSTITDKAISNHHGKLITRPTVLVTAHPLMGHLSPILLITTSLIQRGWNVYFVGPTSHAARITATGAKFIPLRGEADLDDQEYYADPPGGEEYKQLHWTGRVCEDLRRQIIEPLPAAWRCVQDALRLIKEEEGGGGEGGVVLLTEAFSWGVLPLFYGASLPEGVGKPKGSVCVSVTIPAIQSVDVPPVGYEFPFDPSKEGRRRNEKLWEGSWKRRAQEMTGLLDRKLLEAGAEKGFRDQGRTVLSGANYEVHDRILQLGVPGLEYPRSDWPRQFRFAGLAQGGSPGKRPEFEWWEEIVANAKLAKTSPLRKKVVVVAQGTVEIYPLDLIVPTLQAYEEREHDVLVVAILGWSEANLDAYRGYFKDSQLPRNARIADFLNYDTVLGHADVWVNNAGFGAVCHGIANGVPMVCAGEGMDKMDNARRVAWSGAGVNLGTQRATAEMVREAVDRILSDEEGEQFHARIGALRLEARELNCFDIVEEELIEAAGRCGIAETVV